VEASHGSARSDTGLPALRCACSAPTASTWALTCAAPRPGCAWRAPPRVAPRPVPMPTGRWPPRRRGLPLVPAPSTPGPGAGLHARVEVLHTLQQWLARHAAPLWPGGAPPRAGLRANAMTVFDVPDARGRRLPASAWPPSRRDPGLPARARAGWPYNLYCMVHGRDRAAVALRDQAAIAGSGLASCRTRCCSRAAASSRPGRGVSAPRPPGQGCRPPCRACTGRHAVACTDARLIDRLHGGFPWWTERPSPTWRRGARLTEDGGHRAAAAPAGARRADALSARCSRSSAPAASSCWPRCRCPKRATPPSRHRSTPCPRWRTTTGASTR
jgi:hypothetical protein